SLRRRDNDALTVTRTFGVFLRATVLDPAHRDPPNSVRSSHHHNPTRNLRAMVELCDPLDGSGPMARGEEHRGRGFPSPLHPVDPAGARVALASRGTRPTTTIFGFASTRKEAEAAIVVSAPLPAGVYFS